MNEYSKDKLKTGELLHNVDDASTNTLSRSMGQADALIEDFNKAENSSSMWSSIIQTIKDNPIFEKNQDFSDASKLSTSVPGHVLRLLGALLCTIELIVEINNKNSEFVVLSLHKILGHTISASVLLDLVQNYKSYFPYSYMFIRRIQRTPTAPISMWKDALFSMDSASANNNFNSSNGERSSDLVISRGKARSALSDDENGFPNRDNLNTIVDSSSSKWAVSDSEEGEDSDVEDVVIPYGGTAISSSNSKKRMTRMSSSSPAKRREELRGKPALQMMSVPPGISSNQLLTK